MYNTDSLANLFSKYFSIYHYLNIYYIDKRNHLIINFIKITFGRIQLHYHMVIIMEKEELTKINQNNINIKSNLLIMAVQMFRITFRIKLK